VVDRTARVIAAVGQAPEPVEVKAVWHAAMQTPPSNERAMLGPGGNVLRIRATAERPGQVDGILAYRMDDRDPVAQGDLDLAGDLLGQELAHRAAVRRAERRYAGELLALAAQDALSAAETSARLQALHLDPRHDLVVVAATAADGGADLSEALADGVEATLRLRGLSSVIIAVSDGAVRAVAALPAGADDTIIDRAALVPLTRLAGPNVAVGVAHGSGGHLRRVITEADHAVSIAAMAPDMPSLARSRETGSHLLLLALHSDEIRRAFVTSVLGPLHSYDSERSTHLLDSLTTFLESGCSWQSTAARLGVHVNTVRYRIRRVEQLTSRDLDSMDDRIDLHLAIKAADLPTGG
jgi:sugar diacid utilization regulator